jgi:hypothetical protein
VWWLWQVVENWNRQLLRTVLGKTKPGEEEKPETMPLGRMQLMEVVDMLQDICAIRSMQRGDQHVSVGDAFCVSALALIHMSDFERAQENLQQVRPLCPAAHSPAPLSTSKRTALCGA